ncbi:hypothetical protein B0T17DRAFT_514096 [Bombardia bombarda]|uniref:Uncharacterized protein n=1 Tax=Bombardia bombarda TaxID=252184 RepID=A0AA39XKF7_9PEZI|nr:hypothetical protein B0T17DRAFT_514096 [Bombardia bombarda]
MESSWLLLWVLLPGWLGDGAYSLTWRDDNAAVLASHALRLLILQTYRCQGLLTGGSGRSDCIVDLSSFCPGQLAVQGLFSPPLPTRRVISSPVFRYGWRQWLMSLLHESLLPGQVGQEHMAACRPPGLGRGRAVGGW